MDYAKELAFAKQLASRAGAIIKDEFYRQHTVTMKANDNPVTVIDAKINELVGTCVEEEFPGDRFDGEEGSAGDSSSKRIWVCDPLDGTKSFLLSVPSSMFMLGLFVDGVEQLAVAYNPITDELYEAAQHKGAYKNGTRLQVSETDASDRAFIVIDAKAYRESDKAIEALEKLGYQVTGVNGTGTKIMKVAEGLAAGTFRVRGGYHDVGVGALIAEEAGAITSSLDGNSLLDNELKIYNGFIIANPLAHADIKRLTKTA
jgi:myo-inositol-1(or 4)-monophosphatase